MEGVSDSGTLKLKPRGPKSTWRGRGLSKSFISRVIVGVTPCRVLLTLLITLLAKSTAPPSRVLH